MNFSSLALNHETEKSSTYPRGRDQRSRGRGSCWPGTRCSREATRLRRGGAPNSRREWESEIGQYNLRVQGSAKRLWPGLVDFVPAVAYHFCFNLPAAFTQPGQSFLAKPCICLTAGKNRSGNLKKKPFFLYLVKIALAGAALAQICLI